MVATETMLLVPGGRSVPAALSRDDGTLRYFEINAGGKGTGGSFVAADEKHFYVHTRDKGTRAFQLANGVKTAFMPNEPVLGRGCIYSAEHVEDQHVIRAYDQDQQVTWEVNANGSGDLILAGNQLIAAGGDAITVIALPESGEPAQVVQSIAVTEPIERLIVADKKLFAVTLDGQLMAFGSGKRRRSELGEPASHEINVSIESAQLASELLATGDAQGYAFWYGDCESEVVQAIAADSRFAQLAVIDANREAIDRVRRQLDASALYGKVTVHDGEAGTFMPPKYVANMVFVDQDAISMDDATRIANVYESVRPYGGVLQILNRHDAAAGESKRLAERIDAMGLEQAKVEVGRHGVIVRREGALPGSADWTHQYGDIANTIKSNDRRVKLPLGVLWFGGSSNMDVLPRHGHGPPEQVVGGRLFIQGINSLSARDVYTGRVLWKRDFRDLGTFDVYYDATYEDTPLDPKYNQVHIPGANGRGTNYVVTDDRIYIVEGSVCHVLDPATGETLSDIRLPTSDESDEPEAWGYLGVYQDVLIGGLGFASYRGRHGLSFESDRGLKASKAGFGSKSLDRAASIALVGFDRHSGEVLWKVDANHSFWHNGIVAGGEQIYCLDRNPTQVEEAMRRRGKTRPETYRIVALDYRSGKPRWEVTEGVFGTWLGYSEEHDLLLQAGAAASDRLSAETGAGMAVYSGGDGSLRWKNESLKYTGPCILHHDLIITNVNSNNESAGAFYLRDGKQKLVPNPITGQPQPWKLTRAYGCNNIIASENLLTFRSGAAGYYDLLTDAGTGNLGGFKSGCTSNLVVANGVLNAPDYTRTCSCAYQNQTSLALVHMPEVESWSVNSAASVMSRGSRIESVGINFGAPGDRRDIDGRLWIEYPVAAGPSPPLSIEFNDDAKVFRHHSSTMAGTDVPWVLASGVEGVTDLRIGVNLQDAVNLNAGIPVNHASDDAEENEAGKVNLVSSDLELVEDAGNQLVGIRFNDIKLARGAVIRQAHVQFSCDEPTDKPTSLIIAAEDSGNAERFSEDSHDLSSRTRTTAEVGWNPPPWLQAGATTLAQRTPDLTSIIESVVRRDDWKSGNSIALLIGGSGKRVASAFRSGSGKSATLIIDSEATPAGQVGGVHVDHYRVRMLFGLPRSADRVEPRFDVLAQGKKVLSDFELKPTEQGAGFAVAVLENIAIAGELHIQFVAKRGQPVLSGIELVRQPSGQSE